MEYDFVFNGWAFKTYKVLQRAWVVVVENNGDNGAIKGPYRTKRLAIAAAQQWAESQIDPIQHQCSFM